MKSVLIFVAVIRIALVVCNTHNYDDETNDKAKKNADEYIRNNYEDIDTIEFSSVEESPMGNMMLTGEANGEAGFTVGMDADTFNVGSVGRKEGFPIEKKNARSNFVSNNVLILLAVIEITLGNCNTQP